ncbi:MAG TPA: HEAT repeat domain-containing protein [Fimbriiglobus sp.]|nr:HEAT repeat domain-containing protein [Fimbriiglobus sp.]
MSIPLLVESFAKLPQPRQSDDPDLFQAGVQQALREFRDEVEEKYTEGTLQRLLAAGDELARRAAALALGFTGTMRSGPALTAALRDDDAQVRQFAADSLREVWFRGDEADHGPRLQQALAAPDHLRAVAALDELIREAPDFAEAYNRRAMLYYQRGEYRRSVADCEAVLRLNPAHFGAAAGMGQCYLRLNRPRAALRAFRQALAIHPGLDEVRDAVRDLEAALGE